MRKYTTSTERRELVEQVLRAYRKKISAGKGHTEACDEIAKEQKKRYTQITYIIRAHRQQHQTQQQEATA